MTHRTTTEMSTDIERRAAIPISQTTFTTENIIDFMNDEQESALLPLMQKLNEEYFVTYTDFSVTSSTTSFEMPSNTIGQSVRDIVLVSNAGGDESYTNLPRLTLEQIASTNTGTGIALTGYSGFYIQGNAIKLYPNTGWSNETLRVYYYKRPNKLVPTSETSKILAIDTGTKVVTVDSAPSVWNTTSTTLECIEDTQPFATVATNITITNISGYDLTLSSVDDMSVGDYLALEGETPIPQFPEECQQLLIQGAVVEIMNAQGDSDGWKMSKEKYTQIKDNLITMLKPRVSGQSIKVVNRNNIFNSVIDRRR